MADIAPDREGTAVRLAVAGHGDLSLVNAWRAAQGLPPARLRWQCQHSCSEPDMAHCEESDCDAAEVLGDEDRSSIFERVEAGDLRGYAALEVEAQVTSTPDSFAKLRAGVPGSPGSSGTWCASLLSWASWASAAPEPDVDAEQLRACAGDALREAFWFAARALMDQRFLRVGEALPDGDFIVFVARRSFPGCAYVAFGSGSDTTAFERAFGLKPKGAAGPARLARHRHGATGLPGELYGPRRRLVVRLQPGVAERLIEKSESWLVDAGRPADQGARCHAYMADMLQELGLAVPVVTSIEAGDPYAAASALLATVMAALPHPSPPGADEALRTLPATRV